ncbi:MAG TPA: histidine ammonia-lyase [Acidimicrobiales bacterium]|jgi:histidine ammonia-lyase|nr:histidine ammonia-lyase [Acidimicrobiales bacterium]
MVVLGRRPLSIAEVVAVARHGEAVEVADDLDDGMAPSRLAVERAIAERRVVYGVTTGFGALAGTRIPPGQVDQVQYALVQSHAAGMGADVEPEVVRAMQLLKARALAAGHSGVRPDLVRAVVALLNAGITPAVPELGSLGASGDLAPLAHAALVLCGRGWVLDSAGGRADAGAALEAAGLEPLALTAKEGLALLNGTEGMLAHLCLAIADLGVLLPTADIACALSVEALRATDAAYAARIQELRPHAGQAAAAANLRALLEGSPVLASHRDLPHAVQDAYSLRCAPQVHGACRDVIGWVRAVADVELASVTDNPVVFPGTGDVVSTGNFHGQPLAYAADFAAIALADLAAISERRTDRLMDPARSDGLPPFLAVDAGVNSGFMLAHYTAAAAVNRLRATAAPSSCDTISTSAGQEDHVSMGWNACRQLRSAVADAMRVVAIELVCAAEAVELRGIPPGPGTAPVLARLRESVPRMEVDRFLAPDLAAVEDLVRTGAVLRATPVALR